MSSCSGMIVAISNDNISPVTVEVQCGGQGSCDNAMFVSLGNNVFLNEVQCGSIEQCYGCTVNGSPCGGHIMPVLPAPAPQQPIYYPPNPQQPIFPSYPTPQPIISYPSWPAWPQTPVQPIYTPAPTFPALPNWPITPIQPQYTPAPLYNPWVPAPSPFVPAPVPQFAQNPWWYPPV